MFTNNFDSFTRSIMLNDVSSSVPNITAIPALKSMEGDIYTKNNLWYNDGSISVRVGIGAYGTVNNNSAPDRNSNIYYNFIWVGTSDSELSKDDYTLEAIPSSIVTNIGQTSSVTNTKSIDNDKVTMTYSRIFTVNNTTDTSITIKEVGLYKGLYVAQDGGSWGAKKFLMCRELLATPITIDVGETKTFTVALDITL